MNLLLDVVKVSAKPGYLLELEFENGEHRLFDMSSIMDKKPFIRLKETNAFFAAHISYGTVVWPGNIDIDPETLYERSVPEIGEIGKVNRGQTTVSLANSIAGIARRRHQTDLLYIENQPPATMR